MEQATDLSWTCLIPPILAVLLAFATREVILSLAAACLAGVLLMGQGPQGFVSLLTRALGSESFIWICLIEVCIGVLIAFFQRCGAVEQFTQRVSTWADSRRRVGLLGWGLGLVIFFSDYFSPLFVGPVMRDLSDKHRISREKLAYICDSTSAPLVALLPMTGWAVYLCGLVIGTGNITDRDEAMDLFIASIPLNFYCIVSVALVGLIVSGLVADRGPMRAAEQRAIETGKVLRDGARPLMDRDLTSLPVSTTGSPSLLWCFALPVATIVCVNVGSFLILGDVKILESFMLACLIAAVVMRLRRIDTTREITETALTGIKGVMPAVVILALAYCINTVTREMHTAQFVVHILEGSLSSVWLPIFAFLAASLVSFATGTSWGTYAVIIPIALPIAFELSGGQMNLTVTCTFAAVVGGGVFGDHCSPLSDTTVLSSLGSACDHIDHVRTQLPYALAVGALSCVLYLVLGFCF